MLRLFVYPASPVQRNRDIRRDEAVQINSPGTGDRAKGNDVAGNECLRVHFSDDGARDEEAAREPGCI